jgi:hypothetical protein
MAPDTDITRACALCEQPAVAACLRCARPLCAAHDHDVRGRRCDRCELEYAGQMARTRKLAAMAGTVGYMAGAAAPWVLLLLLLQHMDSAAIGALGFFVSFLIGSAVARFAMVGFHQAHRDRFLRENLRPLPCARALHLPQRPAT